MAAIHLREFVACLERWLKEQIEEAAETRRQLDEVMADASRAREEADDCPDDDDGYLRYLEELRDLLLEIYETDLESIERRKEFIANQWQVIQDLEASIPPAA